MKKQILIGVAVFVSVLVVGVLVFWGLTATDIITLGIQREIVQHSQQYVETKINLLNKLYNDHEQLEAEISTLSGNGVIEAKKAQQKAVVVRIKTEATMIPENTVPPEIREFISTH